MPTIIALAKEDGTILTTPYQDVLKRKFAKENAGKRIRITIEKVTPESNKQRRMYHGAYLTLWAYLDGKDYRDPQLLADYHEIAKLEFTPTVVMVNGEPKKIGRSSKGNLNELMEKLLDYLVENYGIDPAKVLDPELYKKFRDTIWPFTPKYETFIDYLLDLKYL